MTEQASLTVDLVMVLYLGLLLFIGWMASKRMRSGEDFHLAGRSLGAWAAGISSTASSESGWVTLGAVGMTYTHGISGLWFAPGCLLGYMVNVYLVAPRLRRISAEQGSLTMTDVITRRWGDPKNVLRVTATTVILLAMMVYVASQMIAAGKAFSTTMNLGDAGYFWGVIIGALIITCVTSLGGFRAVAWTDLFQGLLVAAGIVALPLWAVYRFGGFAALFSGLATIDPHLLSASGGRVGPALWGFVVGQLGIGLGYPGMPHVVTRYMAVKGDREIRRLGTIAMLWGIAVFYGAGLCGLVGRVMMPHLADGERALMALALKLTHPVIAGLLLAAVISAILSTVSSQLLVAASAVSYDIIEVIRGESRDDRRSLLLGRATVVLVGLVGILIALRGESDVFWYVLFAWSGLGASFSPLMLMALGRGLLNRYGAFAGMLTGLGVTVVWKLGILSISDSSDLVMKARFDGAWFTAIVLAVVILVIGRLSRSFNPGHVAAVLMALVLTEFSWWLVAQGGFAKIYELVPAFALSALSGLMVSRLPMEDAKVD